MLMVRSCALIIAGERHVGFDCALEENASGVALGFLVGPHKPLKRALMMQDVQIQFASEAPMPVAILVVSGTGLALIRVQNLAEQAGGRILPFYPHE